MHPLDNGYPFTIYSFHGFNVWDRGDATIGQLEQYLTAWGYPIHEIDREHENLVDARWGDDEVVDDVLTILDRYGEDPEEVVLMGHSHGCNLSWQTAWQMHDEFEQGPKLCILFNAALRVDAVFPPDTQVVNFFSKNDRVVTTSKYLRLLPHNWFSKHPWGEAGRKGLRPTPLVRNIDIEWLTGGYTKAGHSTVFQNGPLCAAAAFRVDELIREVFDLLFEP